MRRIVGGQEVEIPEGRNGRVDVNELRSRLGLPRNRMLIAQNPDGSNRVVSNRGKVALSPYEHLIDAPTLVRGGCGS